jgi:hypothetical protein
VIATFEIGDKDQYFHPRKFCNNLQQTRGIYEMVFGLIGEAREVIKPAPDTAKEFLHKVAQTEPRMREFVPEVREQSSKDTTLDPVLYAIVDRFVGMRETVGPRNYNA